jgi:hypothetical protein
VIYSGIRLDRLSKITKHLSDSSVGRGVGVAVTLQTYSQEVNGLNPDRASGYRD